jgi:hypothetical protein
MTNQVIKWKKGRAQPFETRKITKKEMKDSTHLEIEEDLEWSKANNFTVSADNLSDEVIEFLSKDPNFSVSEINKSVDADDKSNGEDGSVDAGKVADSDVPSAPPTNVAKKAASSTPGR